MYVFVSNQINTSHLSELVNNKTVCWGHGTAANNKFSEDVKICFDGTEQLRALILFSVVNLERI